MVLHIEEYWKVNNAYKCKNKKHIINCKMPITEEKISLFNLNDAVVLRNKYSKKWISKLKEYE